MKYSLDRFNFWRFHRRHFSVEILKCRLYFSLNAFTACMHIFVNKCAVSLGPVVWYKWNMSLCNPCNIIYQFNVARRNCANLVGECNLCHFLRLSMNIWIEKRIGFPFFDRSCLRSHRRRTNFEKVFMTNAASANDANNTDAKSINNSMGNADNGKLPATHTKIEGLSRHWVTISTVSKYNW